MNPVLVKVCGVTDASNALACIQAGADYLGLNFHPASSRYLPLDRAISLAETLAGQAELVGLCVDRPLAEVAAILRAIPAIGTLQLHGAEDVAYLAACRELPSRPQVIRAFRLRDRADVAAMVAYLDRAADRGASPDAILVDALVPGQFGGTGHAIPDDLLDHLPGHPRLILAGGLGPDNVADRVARVRPWMVDVASGVEARPGWKDIGRVAALAVAARGV